ncbi:methyltransferase domain-containing protein [Rhodoplanes serenus]|uniref:Methyltransferase domain-containing protein n=1 Tax=Rhodoplanes serenus TaxID=200615 RepID=A0A9X4XLC1_9BRAD|nr:cyclopropane-fatty-acyl-phospholipid synthase family protein [Rhodoplanes serenus]MTW16717.1 methyltransferase domain-containing protein [Rhodoplanes serenus]
MTAAARRLDSFRRLLAHARERLALDVGFVLWDGSRVPADLADGALAVRLADEGVVAAMVRRPNLETLANLWAAGRIALTGGTLFDLVRQRPKVRTKDFLKTLDKRLTLETVRRFLFVSRGGPWPLEAQPSERPSSGAPSENKQNIAYHYDVSNAFYALWLDREMVYTCGYCTDWDNDIDTLQRDKLEHICRKLRLKPGDTLLDVGCGWGALSCYAAEHYGVTAHGVTLSEQQVAFAQEKIRRLGLEDRVRIELRDYSTVDGQYDKVAAIGIQEHIGIDNYPTYYDTVQRVLKPGGLFLHHAITRPAKRDDRSFRRKRPEFALLTKYIFPGGELDHIGNTVTMLERHGFEVHDVEQLREHYWHTCRLWHDRLLANEAAAVAEVGAVKTRMWIAYLAACAIAFERNTVGLYQTVASKRRRGPAGLPPTRADLYRDRPAIAGAPAVGTSAAPAPAEAPATTSPRARPEVPTPVRPRGRTR